MEEWESSRKMAKGGETDGIEEGTMIWVEPTGEGLKESSPAANWIEERQRVKLLEYAPNQGTLDVIDVELSDGTQDTIYDFNIAGTSERGGKIKSARARDRKYTSQEGHEQRYKGKRKSRVRGYMERGGKVSKLPKEVEEYLNKSTMFNMFGLVNLASLKAVTKTHLSNAELKKRIKETFDDEVAGGIEFMGEGEMASSSLSNT